MWITLTDALCECSVSVCVCVCVCVCVPLSMPLSKRPWLFVCVCMCVIRTMVVSLLWHYQCGCLFLRPSVCAVCLCMCVCLCEGPLCMLVRKRPWVFVCLCCVLLCCGDHIFEFVNADPCVNDSARDLV